MTFPPQGSGASQGIEIVKKISSEIKGIEFNEKFDSLEELSLEFRHASHIFPENTNETVTFTAGNVANQFGPWLEIVDNNGVTLSSKFEEDAGHITAIMTEAASKTRSVYLFEIAYGDPKIIVSRYRFITNRTAALPIVQQITIRALDIPRDEKIYYRMACKTANATCMLHFRYHYHS